jgi:hypothetical protein
VSWLTDLVNKAKKPGVRLPSNAGALSLVGNAGLTGLQAVSSIVDGFKPKPGGVLGASTTSSNAPQAGGQTGGQTAPAPNYLNDVQSRISKLNSLYTNLYGATDAITNEQAGKLQTDYTQNLDELNTGYAKNAEQTQRVFGARGAQDSSYYQNAQDEAGSIYNKSIGDLTQSYTSGQAKLGETATAQKARLDAARNQYSNLDLTKMSDQDLANLSTQLDSAINSVNESQASYKTEGQFANDLNSISPIKQQGTQQLASKLQTLVTSSAPIFAKKQIAMGLIRAAQLNDPKAESYWTSFFDNLLKQKA